MEFELYCEECNWQGDFWETGNTRECPQCWNDHLTVTADFTP